MHIYSRNSEDNTGKYPDIVANIPKLVQPSVTGGVVVDCEAVAYDREKDIILPFQAPPPHPRGTVQCAIPWAVLEMRDAPSPSLSRNVRPSLPVHVPSPLVIHNS